MISLNKLMAIAGVGAVACIGMITIFGRKVSKQIVVSTICEQVIEEVQKHKGALHFLGEPLKITSGKFNNMGFEFTDHSDVKVNIAGPKSKGIVFFTLIQKETKQLLVDSIQLQIGTDDTKRLVIKKSSRGNETESKTV